MCFYGGKLILSAFIFMPARWFFHVDWMRLDSLRLTGSEQR